MAQHEGLDVNLRYGKRPRLPRPLRQLGAVGAHVPPASLGSRQAFTGFQVAAPSATRNFVHYMQHEKGPDRADARLFGARDQALHVDRLQGQAQQDRHQFWFLFSPMDATPQTLQPIVQATMAQMQRDLHRPLDWVGAVHHDTDHLHAHVLLRGCDRKGKDLYIAKQYLMQGVRDRVRMFSTYYLGPDRDPADALARLQAMAQDVTRDRGRDGWER